MPKRVSTPAQKEELEAALPAMLARVPVAPVGLAGAEPAELGAAVLEPAVLGAAVLEPVELALGARAAPEPWLDPRC